MSSISILRLQYACDDRQKEIMQQSDNHEEPDRLFSLVELGGEVGEALNAAKKIERERLGIFKGKNNTVEDLAEELADVVICAVLVARRYGIDLDEATVAKFNKTSAKYGLQTVV